MAAVDRFVFVNYTGQPDVEARQSLPTVRQHVMHDFFRRQREADNGADEDADGSAATAREEPRRQIARQLTVQPRVKRPSKRRPSRPRSNRSTPQASSSSGGSICSSEDSPSFLNDTASIVGFSDHSSPFPSVVGQSGLSPDWDAPSPRSLHRVNSVFYSPAVHRLDPFNSLPLNDSSVDHLASWHFYRPINKNTVWETNVPWLDKIDGHFRRELWNVALTSTPLFHVLLCVAEMKRCVLTGDRNQVKYYEHKIAVMRAVSEGVARVTGMARLPGPYQLKEEELETLSDRSTDTFVMLVGIQVNLALGDKEYDAAKTHMRCVLEMANKAGGISTFGYTQWRHTLWNDLKLASALLERPMLPYNPRHETAMLPKEVIAEAHRLSLETVRLIPTSATLDTQTAYDLFNKMHQLNLAFDAQLTEESSFLAVENGFYHNVHQLCNLVADSQSSPQCTSTDMLILGAQLATWTSMPSLINMRALFQTVINTVQSKLVYRMWNGFREKNDLIDFWEQDARLDSLLWILFQVGIAATNVFATGETWMPQYFLSHFFEMTRRVLAKLQITTLMEFERRLRLFPFSEHVFSKDSKDFWRQLEMDPVAASSEDSMVVEL